MFEAGREYKFVTLDEGGDAVSWQGDVTAVALPLITVVNFRRETTILNAHSPAFVSAAIQPHRSPEQKAEAAQDWTFKLEEADRTV